jgi:hypothetical protein
LLLLLLSRSAGGSGNAFRGCSRTSVNDNGNATNPLVLAERLRQVLKRLDDVEKKQKEMETMLNRFVGGSALLVAVGVFVGWLITVGSGTLPLLFNK